MTSVPKGIFPEIAPFLIKSGDSIGEVITDCALWEVNQWEVNQQKQHKQA